MPLYEYQCPECGRQVEEIRPQAFRNVTQRCACRKGRLNRIVSVPAPPPKAQNRELRSGEEPTRRAPTATLKNVTIDNCGGGIRMDGGHLVGDGLNITNTPVGLEMNGGATADLRNVEFRPGKRKRNR